MIHNSRGFALLLSVSVAVVSVMVLWLFNEAEGIRELLTVFLVVFAGGYLISAFLAGRFLYGQIHSLQKRIAQLGVKIPNVDEQKPQDHPLERLATDLEVFINEKQGEIERLRKLEAFRKDFVADVSHELKTPIFAAQGFVHTLLDGADEERPIRRKFLKKAAKSLDGLDMLVQDLLTLSQIETGQIKMRFEDVDLYALTEDVLEQFKDKVIKKDVTLRIDGPLRKVLVYADAQRIGQVLINLISNAIKHSDEEGEVVISFSVRKRSVVTRVKDFGEGIPPEHINRIFERFYRVDKSRSREKGGTGLGLAIVKHILEGHDSKAEVVSKPGKGSVFSFKLPKAKREEYGISEHDEPASD